MFYLTMFVSITALCLAGCLLFVDMKQLKQMEKTLKETEENLKRLKD